MEPLKLPDDVAHALLDKLASDDDFRDMFSNDPDAALATLGFRPPHGGMACMKPRKLADKATIAKVRDEMHQALVLGALAQIPNKIDAKPPKQP